MIISGLLIGILIGLTGVGGAALLTPFLVAIGISPSLAVGTDLAFNAVTKLFGAVQHWRQKTVNFSLVKYLALGSIPCSILATVLILFWNKGIFNEDQLIQNALGYVLIFVAVSTLIRVLFDKQLRPNRFQALSLEQKKPLTILIGCIFGFIVGLTSVGSGSLFAMALIFFYQLKTSDLVGTDIFHAFMLVSVNCLLHLGAGNVDFSLLIQLLAGSIPGVIIGSMLSTKVPAKPLRTLIAVFILASGIKLL